MKNKIEKNILLTEIDKLKLRDKNDNQLKLFCVFRKLTKTNGKTYFQFYAEALKYTSSSVAPNNPKY